MTYSITRKFFADLLHDQRALEHPEEFLGVNYRDVLNFWWFLDDLSEEQWRIVNEHYCALDDDVSFYAWAAAYDAVAAYVVSGDAGLASWEAAANYASSGYAAVNAAGDATMELIGYHKLLEQKKPLTFLSLFDYSVSRS